MSPAPIEMDHQGICRRVESEAPENARQGESEAPEEERQGELEL
jgi:hypothetical protein